MEVILVVCLSPPLCFYFERQTGNACSCGNHVVCGVSSAESEAESPGRRLLSGPWTEGEIREGGGGGEEGNELPSSLLFLFS
ncbi:Hypothetical predicted protein [Xyrichtys novacula]|uniref:Secreted protein n=1 Tax=Xyrichtys novacula TaxID=13765 RepID=A0AAV1G0J0_XYRNO|nr:Hypothetical predicted protein [Xyrichtys novacula]